MLLSMTGFGRATGVYKDKTITIEIRALNSKASDIRFKIPQNFKEKELDLRRIIMEKTDRGKIDIAINVDSASGDSAFGLNVPLFKKYYQELKQLAKELGIKEGDILQSILRIPNVVANGEGEMDEEEWAIIQKTMYECLENFTKFRLEEGNAMKSAIQDEVQNILNCLQETTPFEQERIVKLRQRLKQNLDEFLGKENVDENRFEQEVLFYIEKIDINEEKVRLEQHCKYFLEQLHAKDTVKGRTLNFISQEMGREINTLGAKAYSAEIQQLVVKMKDELEKIKEQLANVV